MTLCDILNISNFLANEHDSWLQCDEDDYGYESRKQASIYEKLISDYERNGENPMDKFTKSKGKPREDAAKTLARVKQALSNPHFDAEEATRRKAREAARYMYPLTVSNLF